MLASACPLQARPAPSLDAVDQGNFAVHLVLHLRRLALVWPEPGLSRSRSRFDHSSMSSILVRAAKRKQRERITSRASIRQARLTAVGETQESRE